MNAAAAAAVNEDRARISASIDVLAESAGRIDRAREALLAMPQTGRVAIAGMNLAAARDNVEQAMKQLRLERRENP